MGRQSLHHSSVLIYSFSEENSSTTSFLHHFCYSFWYKKLLRMGQCLTCLPILVPPECQLSPTEPPARPRHAGNQGLGCPRCWPWPLPYTGLWGRVSMLCLPCWLRQAGNPNQCCKVRKALSCPAPLGVQPSHLLGLHPAKHLSAHSSLSEINGATHALDSEAGFTRPMG